jgi:hypothetical protein
LPTLIILLTGILKIEKYRKSSPKTNWKQSIFVRGLCSWSHSRNRKDFNNAMGQESLTRFDQLKKRKTNKKTVSSGK